jgi:hypothetical protein
MRRNELVGLCWDDLGADKATLSINRGLVAVGYDLHETRGKTANARRRGTTWMTGAARPHVRRRW